MKSLWDYTLNNGFRYLLLAQYSVYLCMAHYWKSTYLNNVIPRDFLIFPNTATWEILTKWILLNLCTGISSFSDCYLTGGLMRFQHCLLLTGRRWVTDRKVWLFSAWLRYLDALEHLYRGVRVSIWFHPGVRLHSGAKCWQCEDRLSN